jgi:molybdate transport system substrate-binding protein
MTEEIHVMSSLAMKSACELLAPRFEREEKIRVSLQFVGGADIGKRLRARETVDLVMLAASAVDDFIREGLVQAGSRVDLVRSIIGVAVKSGAPRPDISSADAIRRAVDMARTVAYSSGPSGVYLAGVFERWGVPKEKLRQTAPGVPSGGLLVTGEADLAFQQVSELLAVKGIDLVGPLPEGVQLVTIFSAGTPVTATNAKAARAFTAFLTSRAVVADLASCGLEPA